jgi:hypothetical protein
MSKRKIVRRRQASRRIYYHLALRGTEVRTMRCTVANIYPTANVENALASSALTQA